MRISAELSWLRSNVLGVKHQILGNEQGFCPQVISGAQRMRIKACRAGLNPLELLGMRAILELRIAHALFDAKQLPANGNIVIDKIRHQTIYGCGAHETSKIQIYGFSFNGIEYRLGESVLLDPLDL